MFVTRMAYGLLFRQVMGGVFHKQPVARCQFAQVFNELFDPFLGGQGIVARARHVLHLVVFQEHIQSVLPAQFFEQSFGLVIHVQAAHMGGEVAELRDLPFGELDLGPQFFFHLLDQHI